MTDAELDHAYTTLCDVMSAAGQGATIDLLCRFALLAILEIDDIQRIETLIARAAVKTHSHAAGPSP